MSPTGLRTGSAIQAGPQANATPRFKDIQDRFAAIRGHRQLLRRERRQQILRDIQMLGEDMDEFGWLHHQHIAMNVL